LTIGLEIIQANNQAADIHAAYFGLGELARLEGNYSEAIKNYSAGLNAAQEGSLYIELPRILDGFAKTECARSNYAQAACIFGASQALRKKWGAIIHAVALPDYDKHIKLLQSRMSATDFKSAWAEGEKMSAKEVCEYALQKSK